MISTARPAHRVDGDTQGIADGLNGILALSREMLAKAEAGTWEDLPGIEARRAAMLERYYEAIRVADPDADDIAGLRALREINDRILELGKIQRRHLVREMSDSSRQRQAAARYRQYTLR